MTQSAGDSDSLPLYNHTARKDWGVAILVREDDGKRGYLFEDGAERTMANGYHQLMRRVERPNAEQIAFYERQRARLETRERASSSPLPGGLSFLAQLDKIHETYPAGLSDPKWLANIRGEGATERKPQHREALIKEARELLAPAVLDGFVKAQNYAKIWESVIAVLSHTDLVPASQLKKAKSGTSEGLRAMAMAARELLHGQGTYEQRFDGYLAALAAIYGEPPHWEIATALSAAYHPTDHVCIHPAAFRQQLKAMGDRGSAPTRATHAGYTRFVSIAKLVSKKLTEQGHTPRDYFDVYDFIRATLGPATGARAANAKAKAKTAAAATARKAKA